jgi:hypothetical protein
VTLDGAQFRVVRNQRFNDGSRNNTEYPGRQYGELLRQIGVVKAKVGEYNVLATANRQKSLKPLKLAVLGLSETLSSIETEIKALAGNPAGQTAAQQAAYAELMNLRGAAFADAHAINDEVATVMNITRAGPGGRPDANDESGIMGTIASGSLGLSGLEDAQRRAFVSAQGGSYKEEREALSATWAKRQGLFTNLEPGKQNVYNNADVEYKTTDRNKVPLWDQKTIFWGQEGFAGRIERTRGKATDREGKSVVGILLDSTFERLDNYERAWLNISADVLGGIVAPADVKEVRAPNPAIFQSNVHVDMARRYNDEGAIENNIKWAEGKRSGASQNGFEVINQASLASTNLPQILANRSTPNDAPYNRYTNDRAWLPNGVYDEYPAKNGGIKNEGMTRFVIASNGTVYLTPTHYKGYSVKPASGPMQVRNPFYIVT